ncbi:MAG: hypothetical protein KKD63_07545 [Proteobacteria bacterium]|nr:hypothetical protein [Desulfobulbaceae bacterium]MBU4152718.1 hypothetical protein [Pseudomonadota bacterium]MDP2105751.1 hypothetical protein [Desulfobulbaceae bacterium]
MKTNQRLGICCAAVMLLFTCSCTRHEVETKSEVALAPIEIKPIHITIDINIKVDRALDNFFGDIDKAAEAKN